MIYSTTYISPPAYTIIFVQQQRKSLWYCKLCQGTHNLNNGDHDRTLQGKDMMCGDTMSALALTPNVTLLECITPWICLMGPPRMDRQ